MAVLQNLSKTELVLTVRYSGEHTTHADHFFCQDVNLWRDVFTAEQLNSMQGAKVGEQRDLVHDEILIPYDSRKRFFISARQWQPPIDIFCDLKPRVGRWYPQGYVRGVATIFPQSTAPMRCISCDERSIEIDINHPLAGKVVSISALIKAITTSEKERGGRCNDWIEEVGKNGPGMQLLNPTTPVDFGDTGWSDRMDEADDSLFYSIPRLVNHIDTVACGHLSEVSSSIVDANMTILDLMASVNSHLPNGCYATGLGMNGNEMEKNNQLKDWVVHNLNTVPSLPFPDESFDAIVCNLSVEYLLYPQKIVQECARVLKNDGSILLSFSNRWFPEKVTTLWKNLHEYERVGYVMDLLLRSFSQIESVSFRNWPRPYDDPHYLTLQISDPLYAIMARKR